MSDDVIILDGRPIGCRADLRIAPEGLSIIGLEAEPIVAPRLDALPADKRRDAIRALRAGEPVQVEFDAVTFRQHDPKNVKLYKRNANGLRFRFSKLGKIAGTFAGKPFLLDHASREQAKRMGTILSSTAAKLDDGEVVFRQRILAVKPEGVEGVLDGTIDRFSIGWTPAGAPVFCSVHGTPARLQCRCRPNDKVMLDDGSEVFVEYEFSDAEGIEVSGVNVPAVGGTSIEEVRAALAREINPPTRKAARMQMHRLASILGVVATLGAGEDPDEGQLVARAEELKASEAKLRTERDAFEQRALKAEGELAAARKEVVATKLDAMIDGAYKAGKLRATRDDKGERVADTFEPFLRRMVDTHGLDGLSAYVDGMPVKPGPIGDPPALSDRSADPNAPEHKLGADGSVTDDELSADEVAQLEKTSKSLGLDFETVKKNHIANRKTRKGG